jgi:hypothetical protein
LGAAGVTEVNTGSTFLTFAEVFQNEMKKSRDLVENEGPRFLGVLYHAQTACVACIGSIMARPDRAFPIEELQTKLRRATIHAAVLQGIHAIEYLIAIGCYAQAAALVRQEIEAVEGLRGIRQGLQKDGATPRLKALRHLGKYYAQLTGIAHLSSHNLLTHIVSNSVGNIDHSFNSEFARTLFGLHVTALVGVAMDMAELRPHTETDLISEEEDWWLSAACGVLAAEGLTCH